VGGRAAMSDAGSLWAALVGQEAAVARLRAAAAAPVHAYLLVAPAGTGGREAARALAAALVCPHGGCGACDACRRAMAGVHPDVVVVERAGPFITVDEARAVARVAALSPLEAVRKVVVLPDFHLVDKAAPALLKTIEEPPPSTVFVVVAEQVPPELVTIASRCARVELRPLTAEVVAAALAAEGVEAALAAEAAAAAGGRLDRARLLVADAGFAGRRALWRSVPARLDGTGATAAVLVDELLASLESVLGPVAARHEAERAALEDQERRGGRQPGAATQLAARHKREERRARTDELRFGLATLAAAYRDRLVAGTGRRDALAALDAVTAATAAMAHNPNQTLLLQGLLVRAGRSVG